MSAPPPVPYQPNKPSVATAVQQYANEYQSFFQQNQTAYYNIVLTSTRARDRELWQRAQIMAKVIEKYRGEIPFGSLMARCRRESAFKYTATEKARYSGGKYGIGPWGITGAWDANPPPKPYGLTKAEAYDPEKSTQAVVAQLRPIHQFIFTVAPATKQDLVFYSWMLFCSHVSGPGYYEEAAQYVKTGVEPWVTRKKKKVPISQTPGLGGNVARCWKRRNQITLQGMIDTAWMASYATRINKITGKEETYTQYTSREGAWRLLVGALDACVWERRRDAVLAGKVLVSETLPMIAEAIQKSVNTGQGTVLEAFRARAASWDRAGNEANLSRSDAFGREAQNGVNARDQNAASNAATVRLATAAELANMPKVIGPIQVFNEKTGLWEI
jgi:hypothetical protein